jgi:3',5'-cyclic AMP phosphodiesterase CpdA
MAIGRFEQDQAERLGRILRLTGEAGYFRVVLIHHPPNLEARHPRLGLYGAKRFRQVVAEHGAELVLHGHTHKSTIYAIPGRAGDVPVIGVAAAGAAQREDGGEDPARYNLFRIERLGTSWACTMREFGFQRLSPDIVLRLSLRIY